MANEHGLFFDSVNGDRVYNSDSFAEWLQKFFTTGVFNGDLQVQPSSGMAVTVGTGYANINGRVRFFDTTQTKTLSVANGTYPRIDTIVVRLDLGNREITCETVQGMYSGNNPSPTAPVRSDGIYEIVLAQIYVGAGVTEITTANITDTRADDTLCGWVTSTVEGVPMSQIVSQMQAEFETWYDHMKDQLDEDAAGHLQLEIDSINSLITELRRIVDCHDGNMATVVSDTATEAISKGSYVMKNNGFRKVTSDISIGDTVDDTKTEITTIGNELTALNNGLIQSGTDGIWKYHKYADGTYHLWYDGNINLLSGTAWIGGYYHGSSSDLPLPSFARTVTSVMGTNISGSLTAFVGADMSTRRTYWLNGSVAASTITVHIDVYGTW